MDEFLKFVGIVALVVMAVAAVMAIWCMLVELIDRLKHNYRIKHRFDKPPTAKCYCIDCKHHDNETKRCYRFELASGYRCTADNWFCWEAEPREKE